MNIRRNLAIALLASMPLVACSNSSKSPSAASGNDHASTALGRVVEKEINKAKEKLETENISLNNHFRIHTDKDGSSVSDNEEAKDSRPKAEITPKGDLLIDGKTVTINDAQRKLLLDYRGHYVGVAQNGMEIGAQGADLAGKAISEAIGGIFSGKSEKEIERSVEAEATRIKAAARQLCSRLPAMKASQDTLAAALPEFRPYATMDQSDIDDCYKEDSHSTTVSVDADGRDVDGHDVDGHDVDDTESAEATAENTAKDAAAEAAEAAKPAQKK
ncbi:YggN family protein [Lysobacter fragariae]